MRLVLAAAALTAIALPAAAQRLDTRVREVHTTADGTSCRLNANIYVRLDESRGEAVLAQPPIEDDPQNSVALVMTFSAHGGASVVGLQILPHSGIDRPPLVSARLLIDGTDSGAKLSLLGDLDHTERGYITVPEGDRGPIARRLFNARWFEFEVIDKASPEPRRYRFDALRIRDVVEVLEIIHYSCAGGRAG
ncbi:MAG: hypothetical protein ACAH11_02305 [Sphingomonas sp.]